MTDLPGRLAALVRSTPWPLEANAAEAERSQGEGATG